LALDVEVTEANGFTEREAALRMLDRLPKRAARRTSGWGQRLRYGGVCARISLCGITPHVARNEGRPGGSALDERTSRHASYQLSQRICKRIEEGFGWSKDGRPLRKMKLTGKARVGFMASLTIGCYTLLRVAKLLAPPSLASA
jgi:hypothetical protein